MKFNLPNKKFEQYLFLCFTLLNLLPVIQGKFFPTLDGPAHLHNSFIISELLFSNNTIFLEFYKFNEIFVPNWIGHLILSFFNMFLPAFLAEKILLFIYLIGLPYGFRSLIRTISPQNVEFSYIIFPFTYSFLFILGFYNFSIAIVLMLFSLSFWFSNWEEGLSSRKRVILFGLITLTFFSHVFIFSLLLFIFGLYISFELLRNILIDNSLFKSHFKMAFKKSIEIFIVSVLPLILLAYYIGSTVSPDQTSSYLNKSELINWIKHLRPLIAYNTAVEEIYTTIIFYIFCILIVIFAYQRVNSVITLVSNLKNTPIFRKIGNVLSKNDIWIILAFIILILYFILPDNAQNAGYFSMRLGLAFFLFLIIALSTQVYEKWLVWFSVFVISSCHFIMINYYTRVIRDLNEVALSCEETAKHVDPNSLVLPLNYSDNWLVGHFSNYLGIDKPVVLLENYELGVTYFPLRWNENQIPNTTLGSHEASDSGCKHWKTNRSNQKRIIDYVFVMNDFPNEVDSCNLELKNIVMADYMQVFKNKYCTLYKKNVPSVNGIK